MGPIGLSVGLCAAAFLMAAIGGALAQDADKGRTEYMENCAGCHGADAKGTGPERQAQNQTGGFDLAGEAQSREFR
jgi:mono/diheme cytochrome c family protein